MLIRRFCIVLLIFPPSFNLFHFFYVTDEKEMGVLVKQRKSISSGVLTMEVMFLTRMRGEMEK